MLSVYGFSLMVEVACPHCEGYVILVDKDETTYQCPHCDELFEVETQSSLDFEAALSEIDDSSDQNTVSNNIHKNKVTNQRTPKPYQDYIDEKFIGTDGMQRLPKNMSPIGLIWSLMIYLWKYYLILVGLVFGFSCIILAFLFPLIFFDLETGDKIFVCIAIPIGIVVGKWSLDSIRDEFSKFRFVHLFIHPSTKVIEMTGRRRYGLSTRKVMNRIKITPRMILEPVSETFVFEGEGGGSSTSYGLVFENSRYSFIFWSSPKELECIQTSIVQNFEVNLLPHREI